MSHHLLSFSRLEAAAESSAYQVCLAMPLPSNLHINGRVPIEYFAIGSGSPCVVPSSDSKH